MATTSESSARRSPTPQRVVLDANVLVPNALRDTLLRAAEAGLYDVRWSATTLVELERTLVNRILPEQPGRAERVRHLLTTLHGAFPVATVIEDETVIALLTNDPKDRHVLAAAVQSRARLIVTNNLRDFPALALRPHRIAAHTPDDFLQSLFRQHPTRLLGLLTRQGADLRQPRTLDTILDTLAQHVPTFVSAIRAAAANVEESNGP